MPVRKLKEFLDGEKVKYVCISHLTAEALASGKQFIQAQGAIDEYRRRLE